MNPYVRCVHDSGVPKIRSLQELLSQRIQPDPAEPDTPCLRPSHGPPGVWAQAPEPPSFDDGRATMMSAHGQSTVERHADPSLAGAPAASNPSPVLTFTADSVATPNTFATVKTHEMRILSRLTKRLRWSERHQDMPFGEPVEMMLAEADVGEDTEGGSEDRDSEVMDVVHTGRSGALAQDPEDLSEKQDEAGVQLLPCSTRDRAEAAAVQETPPHFVAVSRPAAASNACPQHVSEVKEGIVSSPSSGGIFCTLARGPTPPDGRKLRTTDVTPADSSDSSPQQPHYTHGQQQQHSRPAAVPLRTTYPAPVARLEESPYHYIMRNYIGGTFLYYSTPESKDYFLRLCHRVVAQVRPLLEQETLSPHHGLFPRINAPAFVFGDIHGNFEDLSFFLKRLLIFHDFNLTPANILCLGDYVDRGPFSLECVMLLFSLKIMNASKIVMLRGNHEDRVVCGDLRTYGRGCFLAQCHTVFGYTAGTKLFREVTALFKYLPLAAELVIPSTPNLSFLRSQQTVMHPNLYVSQPAVLLHDGNRTKRTASTTSLTSGSTTKASSLDSQHLRTLHRDGEVASGDKEGDETLSKNSASAEAVSPLPTGYNTIADASLARGQPSRHEAHEERILCTHGGIPRFDRSPYENSLASLRSLSFPRMLTLFPNNPAVKDDAECMPDYFVKQELEALWRRYPSAAPPGFTAACRREAAEAAAAATASTSTPAASKSFGTFSSSLKLQRKASSGSAGSSVSGPEVAAAAVPPEAEASSRPSSCSAASSASRTASLVPGVQSEQQQQPQGHKSPPVMRSSSDYLPQLTEDDVRKSWYTMFDLLWSDPTPMELEEAAACVDWESSRVAGGEHDAHRSSSSSSSATAARGSTPSVHVNEWGFTVNTRGSNVVSFSAKAVDTFLTAYHYSMLFRAHQEKAHGLRWSKSSKVLTIFSSSNYMGHRNGAGCVVVAANGEVQMIEKVVTM
ncbi:serine/threonine protein phosphatase-like protein [Leishmania mexicana MHOM/GT/2001/U1103]|uniref:protein-serine/threonine phosphatase n=1 Tax=Leishmania mexicana (strain MHOM/GT/2001/U1103) TaxID=929439 RepID=E9AYJ0_LEIMU|nr:serine/threonine protein phosphatase-like protein [Leishmania mexicana MHOM/GT/2001/U1103]CBZ28032.1 serine/threonine protein phosphatase-like protein [Leishmania mexicana MHOM/GT/2001/U1103]